MTIAVRPATQAAQALLDQALGVDVDVRGRLVEHQDPRVGDQRPREREQLALAGRQLHAALADLRVVAVLERLDERVGADRAGRGADLVVGRVRAAERDVLADRAAEQERLLGHDPHLRAQRLGGDVAQVVAVDQHRARRSGRRSARRAWRTSTCRRRSRRPARPSARAGSRGRRPAAPSVVVLARPYRNDTSSKRSSPRIAGSGTASGASTSSGCSSSSSKILSSAAIPDW